MNYTLSTHSGSSLGGSSGTFREARNLGSLVVPREPCRNQGTQGG